MVYLRTAAGLVLLSLLQQSIASPVESHEPGRPGFRTSIIPSSNVPKAHTTSSPNPRHSSHPAVDSTPHQVSTQDSLPHTKSSKHPHQSASKKHKTASTGHRSEGVGGSEPSHHPSDSAEPATHSAFPHVSPTASPRGTHISSPVLNSGTSHSKGPEEQTSSPTHSPSSGHITGGEESESIILSPTVTSEPFPTTFQPTSTTIDKAQETSQAPALSHMFVALYADRINLDNPKKKQKYIDDVDYTKKTTDNYFKSLKTQPDPPPGCSGSKKRSLGSTLKSLAGDIPKLASCATKVVNDLEKKIKLPDPPKSEINDLTETLNDISEYMKTPEKDTDPSSASSDTTSSTSTSSKDCTSGTAVPHCTETISLSTSFYSGTTGKSTVSTVTTTTCSTITTCDATATTKTSTVSTSTGTSTLNGQIICGYDCKACKGAATSAPSSNKRSETVDRSFSWVKRTLDLWKNMNENLLEYFEDTTGVTRNELTDGTIKVVHERDVSTARTINFRNQPGRVFVDELVGCTSVAIISEAGAWLSHHWEDKMFTFTGENDIFDDKVLNAIRSGNGDNMPAAFPLGQEGGILHSSNNPQIYIMTPENYENRGSLLYEDKIMRLEKFLTGNDSPWRGMSISKHVYAKPEGVDTTPYENSDMTKANNEILEKQRDNERRFFQNPDAKGRVLVEYDPHQTLDPNSENYMDDQTPAKAMWRLYMENFSRFDQWCPRNNQQTGQNQKRAACSMRKGNSSSPSTHSATTSHETTTGSSKHTKTDGSKTTTSPTHTTSAFKCEPFEDPDKGKGAQCQCPGSNEMYPPMSSSAGMKNYDLCGYTALPTRPPATTEPPFTATLTDGNVVRCASSTYYNYAVNTVPECAGSSTVISTITSIASTYSASLKAHASSISAASASSWSSAAAQPSAECTITDDDGMGDSAFEIYGINNWAGNNGDALHDQEAGCGWIDNWEWTTGQKVEFEGKRRDTQYATFSLSFFKSGCVERAVKSAGGPDLTCHHKSSKRDWEGSEASDLPASPQPSKRWKLW